MGSAGTIGRDESSSFTPFTKAERIQQLNDIDKSITQLLESAGLAIKTLSASQQSTTTAPSDRKEAFQEASNSYLKTLQTVDVRFRRQIYGLEEADIIPADKIKGRRFLVKSSEKDGPLAAADNAIVTEGSMGKLDIGWLNSRSGRVGRDMEAELWRNAKNFLEGLEQTENGAKGKEPDGNEDEHMEGS